MIDCTTNHHGDHPQAGEPWPSAPKDVYVPNLPEFAKLDPGIGEGAGELVETYKAYGRKISPMTPNAFHEAAALFTASVVIARRVVLRMPFAPIYPNLYILWNAPSSLNRKTTGMGITRRLLTDVAPHLIASEDTTPEALISDMAGSEPTNYEKMPEPQKAIWSAKRNFCAQLGWFVDELSGLLASMGRDYNAGLLETLLRAYECPESFTRSTRAQGWLQITNSYLCLFGASTPEALSKHLQQEHMWTNGFWPRFAILTPSSNIPEWMESVATERPVELENGLRKLYEKLPAQKWPKTVEAIPAAFGKGVEEAWKAYNKALSYDLQLFPGLDSKLKPAYARLPTHLLKVSTILAALDWENSPGPQIELSHLAKAMQIIEGWRISYHRALLMAHEDRRGLIEERLFGIVAQNSPDGITYRDICRSMRDVDINEVFYALAKFCQSGEIEEFEKAPGPEGGRPTTKFRRRVRNNDITS